MKDQENRLRTKVNQQFEALKLQTFCTKMNQALVKTGSKQAIIAISELVMQKADTARQMISDLISENEKAQLEILRLESALIKQEENGKQLDIFKQELNNFFEGKEISGKHLLEADRLQDKITNLESELKALKKYIDNAEHKDTERKD